MNLYSSFRSADEKTGEEDANNTDDAVSMESEPSPNKESQLPTPVLCQAIQEDKSTNLYEQQNKIKSNQGKSTVTIEVLKQVENVPPVGLAAHRACARSILESCLFNLEYY